MDIVVQQQFSGSYKGYRHIWWHIGWSVDKNVLTHLQIGVQARLLPDFMNLFVRNET